MFCKPKAYHFKDLWDLLHLNLISHPNLAIQVQLGNTPKDFTTHKLTNNNKLICLCLNPLIRLHTVNSSLSSIQLHLTSKILLTQQCMDNSNNKTFCNSNMTRTVFINSLEASMEEIPRIRINDYK